MRIINLLCAAVIATTVIPFAQENDLYRPTVAFMPFTDVNAGDETDIPLPPGGDMPAPPGDGIPAPPGGGTFDVAGPLPWLSNGIPEMMYFILERTYQVNLYNLSDMMTVLKKHDNSDLTADTPFDTMASAAKTKGVEYIVGGSFDKQAEEIAITIELFDIEGTVIGTKDVSGNIVDIFKLEEEAAKSVLALLDITYTDKIMLRDPTSSLEAYKFFSLGSAKYYTGERLAQFQMGINIDPNFTELHLKIAEANRLEGAAEFAKTSYETARGLSDVYPEAPAQLGILAKKLSPETPETVKTYADEALAMDDRYVKAIRLLSRYYYTEKEYKTATEYCEKWIAIQPGNKMAYYSLGNSLWQIGVTSPKWKKILNNAIKQYTTAIEIDPRFGEAYYARGSLHSIFENADGMISDFKDYLKYKPKAANRIPVIDTIYKNGGSCAGLLADGYVTQEEIDTALAE